jgi:hypothetical protein
MTSGFAVRSSSSTLDLTGAVIVCEGLMLGPPIATVQKRSILLDAMRFKVYLMRRNGRRLPWREIVNSPHFVGDLTTYNIDRAGERYTVATLAMPGAPLAEKQVPDLYEPVIIGVSHLALRLRGFERVGQGNNACGVVQEWHCEAP